MTLKQVVPWESDDQEQQIRRWLRDLTFLQRHGYVEFYGPLCAGITPQQRDFLWALSRLDPAPLDKDLLQQVYHVIQSAPAWLRDLEQFIRAAREKIVVVPTEELLQWTDEQLQEAVKAGKKLRFADESWGAGFEITWDEQAQAFYDRLRRVHFAGIAGFLIHWMTRHIELEAPTSKDASATEKSE